MPYARQGRPTIVITAFLTAFFDFAVTPMGPSERWNLPEQVRRAAWALRNAKLVLIPHVG